MDWKDSTVNRRICKCTASTKGDILRAIHEGARSVEDIIRMTGAGASSHEQNPNCMDCRIVVAEMLEYYGAFVDALKKR